LKLTAEVLQAQRLARSSAERWAEKFDDIPDLGLLCHKNTFMVTGTELGSRFMENIVSFPSWQAIPETDQLGQGVFSTADHR
jgi:hypothetical protein